MFLVSLFPNMTFAEPDDASVYLLRSTSGRNRQSGARDQMGNLVTDRRLDGDGFEPFKVGIQTNFNEHFCADTYHINEGHADNNHRDGFGVTGCA